MAAGVLRNVNTKNSYFSDFMKEKYCTVLRWALGHRIFVLFFALLVLVFSGYFAISAGTSFLPETESAEMTLTVKMDENASDETLWETTDQISEILLGMDDVKSVAAVADRGGMISSGGVSDGNATIIYVVLEDKKKISCATLEDMILLQTKDLDCDIDVSAGSYDISSLYDDGIHITVSGDDLAVLADITADMGELLLSVEGLDNVKSSVDTATPTLKVSVNKPEAMKYGLTVSEVYEFISRSIKNSANATTLSDTDTDVIVIDGGAGDLELADIQNLKIHVQDENGVVTEVPVGSIAVISEEAGAPVIYRDNQIRYMTASATITDGYNVGLVSEEVNELIAGYEAPEGYRISVSGEETVIDTSSRDLLLMIGLAFLLIYLIMVAQFQSLRTPLIIILTVPLSFAGGFLALLISGGDMSVVAMVGFLLLSGIVVNNGIVLVDYINRLRRFGKVLGVAIIEGACTRMRPILMTASTTVLAVLTLAFGLGNGAELVQPMAIVVLGGMIYAIFVTIFVLPALYDLILRRKADTVAETEQGFRLDDDGTEDEEDLESAENAEAEAEPASQDKPEKQGFLARFKRSEEEDEDDEEEEDLDDEDEEEEEKPRFRFFRHRKEEEDEDEEENEEDLDEEDEKPRFRFFRRRDEDDDEDLEEDSEDEEEDDEDEEKPRFRFFHRRHTEDEEDIEEEDEEDDEDDEEVTPRRRRFPFSLFGKKAEEEEEDDEDDDEDYYGIRSRHHQD